MLISYNCGSLLMSRGLDEHGSPLLLCIFERLRTAVSLVSSLLGQRIG